MLSIKKDMYRDQYLDDIVVPKDAEVPSEQSLALTLQGLPEYPDPLIEYREFFGVSKCAEILRNPTNYKKEEVIECLKKNLFNIYLNPYNVGDIPEIINSYLFRRIPFEQHELSQIEHVNLDKLPIFKGRQITKFHDLYQNAKNEEERYNVIINYIITYLNIIQHFDFNTVINHLEYFLLELRQSFRDKFDLIFNDDEIQMSEPELSYSLLNMEVNANFSMEDMEELPMYGFKQSALTFKKYRTQIDQEQQIIQLEEKLNAQRTELIHNLQLIEDDIIELESKNLKGKEKRKLKMLKVRKDKLVEESQSLKEYFKQLQQAKRNSEKMKLMLKG